MISAALFIIGLMQLGPAAPVARVRDALFDGYQRLIPRQRLSAPVTNVVIDEGSLAEFGQWPWPRTILADLVKGIAEHEPAAIGFDMFFPERDRHSPEVYAETEARELPPKLRSDLRNLSSNDRKFADAIQGAPVVMGISGEFQKDGRSRRLERSPATVEGDVESLLSFAGHIQSLPLLHDAAKGWAVLNAGPATDGVTRTIPVVTRVEGRTVLGMAPELLRIASGSQVSVSAAEGGLRRLRIGEVKTEFQQDGLQWIHFGRLDSSLYVPAHAVLKRQVAHQLLNRKVIIVGVVGLGLLDYKITPLGEYVPGLELHTQLVEQIFDGRHLVRPAVAQRVEVFATLALGVLIAALARFASLKTAVIGYVVMLASAGITGLFMFGNGVLIDIGTPVLAWSAAFAFALGTSLMMARKAREKAVYMFSRFVNPHVVKELLKDESLSEGGRERRITLLFTDIRNFTSLSERQTPTQVVSMLNAYFSRQVEIVFKHKGALDKFIGDAMMVFWGAPLDDPEHAKNAVRCALEMADEAREFNAKWAAADGSFDIGIGIHTGDAVVGLIGSDSRREYTAIGAAVNVASRVEGLTKEVQRRVLVTQATVEACAGAEFEFEKVGSYSVKGVERLIEVFEPRRPTGS